MSGTSTKLSTGLESTEDHHSTRPPRNQFIRNVAREIEIIAQRLAIEFLRVPDITPSPPRNLRMMFGEVVGAIAANSALACR